MNKHQRETLNKIFEEPVRSDVRWQDVVSLIKGLGGLIKQGNGSRFCFFLNGIKAVFHKPHPETETDKGALKDIRKFLKNAGVKP